jgi:hypothetical protein
MTVTAIVILSILIVLALVVAALVVNARRRNRSLELQDRFGPEYDRAVERDDPRAAEAHLSDVARRRDAVEIRDLPETDRDEFSRRWTTVQAGFVEDPTGAARDADRLIVEVMRKRGYPVDDFDTKVDMLSADHPEVVEQYRAAHAITGHQDRTTEDVRQAFMHYRLLFAALLDDGVTRPHARPQDDDRSAHDRADAPGS